MIKQRIHIIILLTVIAFTSSNVLALKEEIYWSYLLPNFDTLSVDENLDSLIVLTIRNQQGWNDTRPAKDANITFNGTKLWKQSSLKYLYLEYPTYMLLDSLSKLKNLEELIIQANDIPMEAILKLPRLKRLELIRKNEYNSQHWKQEYNNIDKTKLVILLKCKFKNITFNPKRINSFLRCKTEYGSKYYPLSYSEILNRYEMSSLKRVEDGYFSFNFNNGNKAVEGWLKSGKRDSTWRYYNPKGDLIAVEERLADTFMITHFTNITDKYCEFKDKTNNSHYSDGRFISRECEDREPYQLSLQIERNGNNNIWKEKWNRILKKDEEVSITRKSYNIDTLAICTIKDTTTTIYFSSDKVRFKLSKGVRHYNNTTYEDSNFFCEKSCPQRSYFNYLYEHPCPLRSHCQFTDYFVPVGYSKVDYNEGFSYAYDSIKSKIITQYIEYNKHDTVYYDYDIKTDLMLVFGTEQLDSIDKYNRSDLLDKNIYYYPFHNQYRTMVSFHNKPQKLFYKWDYSCDSTWLNCKTYSLFVGRGIKHMNLLNEDNDISVELPYYETQCLKYNTIWNNKKNVLNLYHDYFKIIK